MRIYEGMFVLDDVRSSNWDAVVQGIRGMMERREAEIFTCERWDERRLAYRIRGRDRAVYVLVRFTAPRDTVRSLERDCQLDDKILRVLFTRDLQTEKLAKAGLFPPKPEEPPEQPPEQPPGEQADAAPADAEPSSADQAPSPSPPGEEQPAPQPQEDTPAQETPQDPPAPTL